MVMVNGIEVLTYGWDDSSRASISHWDSSRVLTGISHWDGRDIVG